MLRGRCWARWDREPARPRWVNVRINEIETVPAVTSVLTIMDTFDDDVYMGNVIDWSREKNRDLIEQRGVSFETVVSAMEQGDLLDVLDHPNQDPLSRTTHLRGCHPSLRSPGAIRNTAQWHPISEDDHSQPQGYEGIQ